MPRILRRLFLLPLILCASALLAQDEPPPAPPAAAQEAAPAPAPETPAADANKALVRRYLKEVLSDGNLRRLDELIAPDFVDSTPVSGSKKRGPAAVREAQNRARTLFQSIEYRLDDLIAEGDRVVARYTVQATRRTVVDAPDSGRAVEVIGMTMFRVADGRIQEAWVVNDQVQLFRQLGYTLEPPKEEAPPAAKPQPKPGRPAGKHPGSA